jgi:predicted HicB family RNase H-like nuclease
MKEAVAVHCGEMLPARVTLGYKGYIGVALPDHSRGDMHGKVVNTRDVISFVGQVDDLEKELKDSVEFYLEACAKYGRKPDKPTKHRPLKRE